ncbi:MAG: hypothetical protein IKF97_00465 [Clostridia bacterium]|nr:hypothetical protein [Clostridia bacterium]
MAEIKEVNGVFGGVTIGQMGEGNYGINNGGEAPVAKAGSNLPVKAGFWSSFKSFLFQDIPWNHEIKVVLTPYQQKVEDEINEFLHQDVTWEKIHDFLFQDVTLRKKKNA